MKLITYTDGGSRNNPGPAAIGGILMDTSRNIIDDLSEYIGTATNNEAEYTAMIRILELAKKHGATEVDCYLDSELIVKQVSGEYRVKHEKIKPLFAKLQEMRAQFERVTFTHVPREQNKEADARVNKALDAEGF